MSTPHKNANPGDIAKTVLMAGDPLRAKFIADNFLENVKCFNKVRNMYGFTGTYKGHIISVMGSGMGMPSIGIYSYELFKFYDVDNIIRIGTAGAYKAELDVFDLVLVESAFSESTYALSLNNDTSNIQFPSKHINEKMVEAAKELNYKLNIGKIHSSDVFYHSDKSKYMDEIQKQDCLCVEMESFALFANAKECGKNAACILTISDSLVSHKETTAEERQTSLKEMIRLALETAIKL